MTNVLAAPVPMVLCATIWLITLLVTVLLDGKDTDVTRVGIHCEVVCFTSMQPLKYFQYADHVHVIIVVVRMRNFWNITLFPLSQSAHKCVNLYWMGTESFRYNRLNSSPPSAAYMRRLTGSALVARSAPSQYLNQCWSIVNLALRNTLQLNLNRNTKIHLKMSSVK